MQTRDFDLSKKHIDFINGIDFSTIKSKEEAFETIQKTTDFMDLTLIIENLSKKNANLALFMAEQILAKDILEKYNGSFDKNLNYAVLCAEPGGCSIDNIQTKAEEFTIKGSKTISQEQLKADVFLVFAKDENNKAAIYEMNKTALNILSLDKNIAGSDVSLTQVEINSQAKSKIATISREYESIQTKARTLIAAGAIGIAHSSLVAAIETSKSVKNYTGQALSANQSVQFSLADMFVEIEAARALTYLSANLVDTENPNIKYAAMAKVQASNAAVKISSEAFQMLGNFGFMKDNSFADIIKSAINTQIKGGTNRVQQNQIYNYLLAKK